MSWNRCNFFCGSEKPSCGKNNLNQFAVIDDEKKQNIFKKKFTLFSFLFEINDKTRLKNLDAILKYSSPAKFPAKNV